MRRFLAMCILTATVPSVVAAQVTGFLPVAEVNGETITRAQFDRLWSGLSSEMRQRYAELGGGRPGYLETVIQRRLILQEAVNRGYDTWPGVKEKEGEEKEQALFDLYVREVVAPTVVTDEVVRAFYDQNSSRMHTPERVKLRLIAISTERRMPADARAIAQKVLQELLAARPQAERAGDFRIMVSTFARAAQRYSEHPSAESGGDLGWVDPDKLIGKLSEAARMVPEEMVSGILDTPDGYSIILVEKRQAPGPVSFDAARDAIRERLIGKLSPQIVTAAAEHARKLRESAKVTLMLENLQ